MADRLLVDCMRVLFVAPCHVITDERVLRTVRAALARDCECFLAVDEQIYSDSRTRDLVVSASANAGPLKGAALVSLPEVSSEKSLARLQRLLLAHRVVRQARMLKPDLIHVHESGILGLLLAFLFKLDSPRAIVYFDYHDWIPFELSVFLGHIYWLYRLILPSLTFICRLMIMRLDAVIAVSEGQASWVRGRLRCRRVVVIPNVRPAIAPPDYSDSAFEPSLVFVGNVMRSRRLELLLDVVAGSRLRRFAPRFHVFGGLADAAYRDELLRLAEVKGVADLVDFHGPYGSDLDISKSLRAGAIAYLFPLTFAPNPAAIEAISSSNKFFTYATLGLPMLVHKSYVEMGAMLAAYGAGFAFSSLDEFVDSCVEVWSNPGSWLELSRASSAIAASMNNDVYEQRLQQLYD
jgi:glycosyltransferase involved in cell wall biosynthesis